MKNKVKASTIVITGIVTTVAISAGLAVGIIFGKVMSSKGGNPEDIIVDPGLEDDYEALMNRYKEDSTKSNYRPYELANISWLKFAELEHTHTVTHGLVDAGVIKQKIFAHDVRVGNMFFTESLSYSDIKKCGVRFFQDPNGVDTYFGSSIKSDGTATWSEDNKEPNTFAEHENKWGKTLDRPIIYIISSQTVINETLTESDGGYVVDLDLDKDKSVQRYKKQMVSISKLEEEPDFKRVHVRFTFDGDLNLNKFEVEEAYTVHVVGTNNSTATLTQEFYCESDEQIPGLHDNYNY